MENPPHFPPSTTNTPPTHTKDEPEMFFLFLEIGKGPKTEIEKNVSKT